MTKIQKKFYLSEGIAKASAMMAEWEGISQSAYLERALRRLLASPEFRKVGVKK